tara:strand:- start:281 stop:1213 length:933 start_codon:yes stop_codon:yes gene_type:complete
MTIENKNCPICKKKSFNFYKTIESKITHIPGGLDRSYNEKIMVLKCKNCKLFKTFDLNNDLNLEKIYTEESISYEASLSKHNKLFDSSITTDEFNLITKKAPAKLLEIGCGAGQFLLRANNKGYKSLGIDLDKKAIDFVTNNLKLNAKNCKLIDLNENEKYDIVFLMGVFEHIEDPNQLLQEIKLRLKEDGELIIGLPNAKSLNFYISNLGIDSWDMFLEPGHIFHYQKQNLKKLLSQHDFKLVNYSTGTVKIRGKIPFLVNRNVKLEKFVNKCVKGSKIIRWIYIMLLKFLDLFKMGDILIASFKVNKI